jgi:hypothetical protein
MPEIGKLTVKLTAVVDRASVERAREQLRAAFDGVIADPKTVADVVDRVMQTAPLVRYIGTF